MPPHIVDNDVYFPRRWIWKCVTLLALMGEVEDNGRRKILHWE